MKIHFYKYQATGNDFILIDNRSTQISLSIDQIKKICDRKFGIGADGLMLIEKHPEVDFKLVYYNSDGSQSLCGNGSRAAVQFASKLGIVQHSTTFEAYDGKHQASLLVNTTVQLAMHDVHEIKKVDDDYFIHTGSPHVIRFVDDVLQFPVFEEGKKIRYSEAFRPNGTNVNFVELRSNNTIFVRTYERGVENETLSCGTGVTAAALAASEKGYASPVTVKTLGGELSVAFEQKENRFQQIFLIGPAVFVFEGDIDL